MMKVAMGCSAGLGQGGLGGHLEFVRRAAASTGRKPRVYCRSTGAGEIEFVLDPPWKRLLPFTPARWLPALRVYLDSVTFDRSVAARLPKEPLTYHCFPGYAEQTFRLNRLNGGVNILEAATTHADDLFLITEDEHRRLRIGGSPYSRIWTERVKREYELSDYITVASTLQLDSFIRRGFPKERLLLAPLGVDIQRFSPAIRQPSLRNREKGEPFRIVQVGQVSVRKGFLYLLQAVEKLRDPEIEVILFGGIGWRPIQRLIDSYREKGLNIRLGAGDPVPVLREAHLCVHSSIEDGFGLAPLEAMAAGLPTIVTDMTGMKDTVSDGHNGLIVPARDAEALARHIADLKHNDEYRMRLGKAARIASLKYDVRERITGYARTLEPIWGMEEIRRDKRMEGIHSAQSIQVL